MHRRDRSHVDAGGGQAMSPGWACDLWNVTPLPLFGYE
jgi:hypothetical protein